MYSLYIYYIFITYISFVRLLASSELQVKTPSCKDGDAFNLRNFLYIIISKISNLDEYIHLNYYFPYIQQYCDHKQGNQRGNEQSCYHKLPSSLGPGDAEGHSRAISAHSNCITSSVSEVALLRSSRPPMSSDVLRCLPMSSDVLRCPPM